MAAGRARGSPDALDHVVWQTGTAFPPAPLLR